MNEWHRRVTMHYEVEVHGLRRRIELPFVTAVIADFSGRSIDPLPPVSERTFVTVDRERLDDFMATVRPRAAFMVSNLVTGEGVLNVDLSFSCLADFDPGTVLKQIDPLRRLLESRNHLQRADHRPERSWEERMRLALTVHLNSQGDLGTLASLDQRIDAQLNAVMHHPDLQRLEATWRGLHHLLEHSRCGDELQIRALDLSKNELHRTLKRYKGGAWDQSPLFKKLYGDGYGSTGGDPIGCVVIDHEYHHSPPDVEALSEIAKIGEAMHAPILTSASPSLLQMDTWRELHKPRDLGKIVQSPEYTAWRALRESDRARYLVLTLPRFVVRPPAIGNPGQSSEYAFQEDVDPSRDDQFVWASSAYLLALVIHQSFSRHAWCTHIRGLHGGGAVEDLPRFVLNSGEELVPKRPVEVSLHDARIAELTKCGLVTLAWHANAELAVFTNTPTLQRPPEYDQMQATEKARRAADLRFLMAVNRLTHYLRAILRDRLAGVSDISAAQNDVERWITDYVSLDASAPGAFACTPRPFASIEVAIVAGGGEPAMYSAQVYAIPHL